MRFALLGPVRVADGVGDVGGDVDGGGQPEGGAGGGGWREVRGAMPRTVLAALLLEAGAAVSVDQLVDALWGERPPASATASLHNHLMRLRRFLGVEGASRIRSVGSGYLIRVEAGELDLHGFEALASAGALAVGEGRWAEASRDLTAALALWRGEPAADAPGAGSGSYAARLRRLAEARLTALEGRISAELELGLHREATGELRALTARYPAHESFHGQLMLALYRSDRQAEALDAFLALRRTMLEELGIEPSASIQSLHRRILNADPELAVSAAAGAGRVQDLNRSAATQAPPREPQEPQASRESRSDGGPRHQLPADTRVFTGRARELEQLVALAATAPGGTDSGRAVVGVIDGIGGVGKTTLAVRAAHLVRAQFPDGQLFIDLQGGGGRQGGGDPQGDGASQGYEADTGLEVVTPYEALGWLLRSLGARRRLIPPDLGERAAFLRDVLTGTRTLIILDNAADAAQLRYLLPRTPGCLVLVTSRGRLVELDEAHALSLDVPSEADAVALLRKAAGPGRVLEHTPAVVELVALCGRVPLAVRILAARLRHRRTLRIEDLVAGLRDEIARRSGGGGGLGMGGGLGVGGGAGSGVRLEGVAVDGEPDLTPVFELSYSALPAAERAMFRGLGQLPGPDVDAHGAARLAGTDEAAAERLLESLLDRNLLIQQVPGRYRLHELLRAYARSRELAAEPQVTPAPPSGS